MTTYRYQNRDQFERDFDKDFMNKAERIDITDYVQSFLLGFRKKHGRILKMSLIDHADYLKTLLNSSQNRICPYLEKFNGFFYWNSQKVDFIPSNLHKGYLFYFICAYCDRRVKYLYKYRTYNEPSCRTCCKLGYAPSQSRRQTRNLSRLIHKPYLHSEDKYLLAKWAGITREDIPTEI